MVTEKCNPKVSVIIPVYNVKPYLIKCLDSVINQKMRDIEIILIDDESTDGSGEICDIFASRDSRIKLIHKKHERLSAARNDGLTIASAQYIMFVDSDDWVDPEFCRIPYRIMKETDVDVVVFQSIRYGKKGAHNPHSFPVKGVVSKDEALLQFWSYTSVNTWNKLYNKGLFEGNQFPKGRFSEDTAIMHRVIYKANSIYYLDKILYHHQDYRPGSITNDKLREFTTDSFCFNFSRLDDLKSWGYEVRTEEVKLSLLYLIMMGRNAEKSRECSRFLINHECIDGEKGVSWKWKTMLKLFHKMPMLFDLISVVTRKRMKWV